jgi:hypothetical protein
MHETNSPLSTAHPVSFPPRWKAFVLFAVLAVATPLAGCEDSDDGAGPVDASSDTGTLAVCRQSDCMGITLPRVPCENGGTIAATCARGTDNRCTWTQARCTPPQPDAAPDIVPQDARLDGGAGDAGDGGDAFDASEVADAVDAVADLAVD